MAKAKKKITAKKQRLIDYNNILTKNKAKFKAGQSMSRADFVALFGIPGVVHKGSYKKVHKSNLRLVQAQTEINMLMRVNGLYLKSSDYYSSFEVVDKIRTKATVERYSSEVDTFGGCAARLESRMTQRVKAGTWGTYNKVTPKELANINSNNVPSQRHEKTIQRLKLI